MDKLIENWVYWHDNENDWNAGDLGITEEQIPDLRNRADMLPLFNQSLSDKTKRACTIVNAYREYCYQTNHTFSHDELDKIIDYAYTMWYSGESWSSSEWQMCIYKYFGKKIPFVRVSYNDPLLGIIYKKRNALGITYKGNSEWNIDSDDWVLDGTTFWATTYWHRTSTIFYSGLNICIDDSYAGTPWNIYQVPNLIELVRNWYIYPTFYLWIPLNNTKEISRLNKFKVNCEKTIVLLKEKLNYTNDKKYISKISQDIIDEQNKLNDIKIELKKLN